jgi:hypothetical protein
VLIDLWATWCKNCVVMDETTLVDPAVQARLAGYVKIKHQAEFPDDPPDNLLMKRIGAIGLPASRSSRRRRWSPQRTSGESSLASSISAADCLAYAGPVSTGRDVRRAASRMDLPTTLPAGPPTLGCGPDQPEDLVERPAVERPSDAASTV